MRTAILSAALLTLVAHGTASADSEPTEDDTVAVADTESPDPVWAQVRITYYVESGRTYSGQQTYAGSTACSWNWPIGTRFRLPDGEVFTCNDRGMLGNGNPVGWLDLWRRPDLASRYGPYATVEVLP